MTISKSHVSAFEVILPETSILDPTSPHFATNSAPWSLAYDKSPSLVLIPSTLEQLQATVKCLCDSDLDFAVRGRGFGSSSAADVVLSMTAFDEITFDEKAQIIQIGAGLDWGEVDERLATLVRVCCAVVKNAF